MCSTRDTCRANARQRGFATAKVSIMLAIVSLLVVNGLIWQSQILNSAARHGSGREVQREKRRLETVTSAIVRSALMNDSAAVFDRIQPVEVNRFLSVDPRYVGRIAGAADTPGFRVGALDAPTPPGLLLPTSTFVRPRLGDPFDGMRQIVHSSVFRFALERRYTPGASNSALKTTNLECPVVLREVPVTEFALVCWEDLVLASSDSGWRFNGPALVLGRSVSSGATAPGTFALRLSVRPIQDPQIGVTEKVWENAGLAASFLAPPSTLLDPLAPGIQQQSLARRGQVLYFDGHVITSEAGVPSGISAGISIGGVTRVVVNLAQLPQYNGPLDASLPDSPDNRISAYYVNCMTALARDRGVVIVGSSDPNAARLCDVITTNGVLVLQGSHSLGPLLAGTSAGGVLFDNPGSVTWSAYLFAPAPSPLITGTTSGTVSTATGARLLPLAPGHAELVSSEQAYDSVGIRVSVPASSMLSAGFGAAVAGSPTPLVWAESAAGSGVARIGVRQADGTTAYSGAIARGSGLVTLTLSRSQNSVALVTPAASLIYALPSSRPRVETTVATWGAGTTQLDIVASAAGTVLGATGPGTIGLNGLFTMGTLSRFGPAAFEFTPAASSTIAEAVAPRLVTLVP